MASKISLVKNQSTPIPTDLDAVTVTVEWESSSNGKKGFGGMISRAKGLDLDLVVGAINLTGEPTAMVGGPEGTTMLRGAVNHDGDSKGRGKGTQSETVVIDLAKVPDTTSALVIALDAFKPNVNLGDARNVVCVLRDSSGAELGAYEVPMTSMTNTAVLAVIKRADGAWKIKMLAAPANGGRSHDGLIRLMAEYGRTVV